MRIIAVVVLALFLTATGAFAQAPKVTAVPLVGPAGAPTLDELAAAKIEALMYRKALLETQHAGVRAELERLIAEAAKKAGVDPRTHTPDVGAKTWVPAVKP